ncbi:MAG: glycosyltransferase family 39 protein [Micromonosporaceae bacterium]
MPPAGLSAPQAPPHPAPARAHTWPRQAGTAALPRRAIDEPEGAEPEPSEPARRASAAPAVLCLLGILVLQAALSLRFVWSNTAFVDEGLYLWSGHLEIAHWLHGTRIPAFPTYFSGAPVVYPPLAALADSGGGLAGARFLSMGFMLGATALLWGTASRLYGRRAAFFAAALFAVLGPTLHLSAYATYDAMSLFLTALAAWCVTDSPRRKNLAGWIFAGAAALALANAAKYATGIFDPVVAALAILAGYPRFGRTVAPWLGAFLVAASGLFIVVLLHLGGPLYFHGISKTTTMRATSTSPVSLVIRESWHWTALVAVLAVAGVFLTLVSRQRWSRVLLACLLALSVLLVPAEQARIHTTISLEKHVDFGAWFAAIAAGYTISQLVKWLRPRAVRIVASVACATGIAPLAGVGASQARVLTNWPDSTRLISVLRPLTAHGGRFLAEDVSIPEYYLPETSWTQWSSTFSITLPSGRGQGDAGNVAAYASAIRRHYFSLVVLDFAATPALDKRLAQDLNANGHYKIVASVQSSSRAGGRYTIWQYTPGRGR